ncbi:hypothetical protein PC112_g12007 [Phytophthora cactorum]|nr:hypothetical protein PC112_g12007 [Phytophthora cactorum]
MVQGFLYFRCVGDHPSRFLSGGDASNSYKFNNREEQDFGYDNMRVMIELPDEGIVYCRGVGDNHTNPEMACVLFDSEGNVRDRYAYLGKLGRWNDIVHLLLIAAVCLTLQIVDSLVCNLHTTLFWWGGGIGK